MPAEPWFLWVGVVKRGLKGIDMLRHVVSLWFFLALLSHGSCGLVLTGGNIHAKACCCFMFFVGLLSHGSCEGLVLS